MKYLQKTTLAILICVQGILSMTITGMAEDHVREKIYIQLDKPFYKQMDVIRFNLTILDARTHLPTAMSDIVYAELINPKGSVVKKLVLHIDEGTAKGDFDLPQSGGIYTLKAYTSWSRNFSDIVPLQRTIPVQNIITTRLLLQPDFDKENYGPGDSVILELNIRDLKDLAAEGAEVVYTIKSEGKEIFKNVIRADSTGKAELSYLLPSNLQTTDVILTAIVSYRGVEESVSRAVPIVLHHIELRFYPEGGHVVENEMATIAFEGIDEYGDGADIKGVIMDDKGEMVAPFESIHDGMGMIQMRYAHNTSYVAKITSPQITKLFDLPKPSNSPVLTLESNTATTLDFNILGGTGHQVKGFNRSKIVFEQNVEGSDHFSVVKETLPVGITRFVLYNQAGNPISERMVFVHSQQSLTVQLSTDQQAYVPGEKVKLNITTSLPNGDPVAAKLAIAVVDDQLIAFADDKSDHILSYFYLSSELKGEVHEPTFYFDSMNENREEALDLLMLTHGWSNYSWKAMDTDSIKYPPEKISMVSGRLLDKDGNPTEGHVYALEKNNKKRMIKLQTDKNGRFVVRNFDPSTEIYLLTKKPNTLKVEDERAVAPIQHSYYYWEDDYIRQDINVEEMTIEEAPIEDIESESFKESLDISLQEDMSALEEVVVIGYGTQRKRELTGSIVQVYPSDIGYFSSFNTLMGKAAGVMIYAGNEDPGVSSHLSFREASSMVHSNQTPLIVVDGVALSASISRNFLHTDYFSPHYIESIGYMNSPEAIVQYGGRADNGILFIDMKSQSGYRYQYSYAPRKGKYNGVVITAKKFSLVREGYQVPKRSDKQFSDQFLDDLVYWNPEVITDIDGKAEISFYTNDKPSAFRITAEGFGVTGLIGRSEETFVSSKMVSMDVKLPDQVGYEDVIQARLMLTNEKDEALTGRIQVTSKAFDIEVDNQVELGARQTVSIPVTIRPHAMSGLQSINFSFTGRNVHDQLAKSITVKPAGFQKTLSYSGSNPTGSTHFTITNPESGTLQTRFVIFPTVINDLQSSAQSLFREPHGCFEQVSSTIYPAILALQYLKSSSAPKAGIEARAIKNIRNGYNKLMAYELNSGGFEWFGHTPTHEALTAFGLLEFDQMKKVYNGVDEEMIQRTEQWLLSRKDSSGGFRQSRGKYGFSAASEEVNNAYIVYALAETGVSDIGREYQKALEEALESGDMYRMALMANAAFMRNDKASYDTLVQRFRKAWSSSGPSALKADHSVVRSYGKSLEIEVVSLWTLALLKSQQTHVALAKELTDYLLKNRNGARFGATQATALALQAITTYNLQIEQNDRPGTVEIWVNDNKPAQLAYRPGMTEPLTGSDFSDLLIPEQDNQVTLKFTNPEATLPYYISIEWYDKTPESDASASVQLHQTMASNQVKVNETVRLTTTIENTKAEGLPMTIAKLGIPCGLSLQTWQLKSLMEKGLFDYYEIIDGYLVLYFKELGPARQVVIPLDLKAEVPGTYRGRANSTYLYYQDEHKFWMEGQKVEIQP